MKDLSLSEQILYSTVQIICHSQNNTIHSSGTGFIYGACQSENGHYSVLITNKHVVCNNPNETIKFNLHLKNGEGSEESFEIIGSIVK